jgi:hypothetical protein
MLVLVLLGCNGPPPGAVGSQGCQPEPSLVGHDCSIWECWRVTESGYVVYRYEWGWDDQRGTFDDATNECWSVTDCSDQFTKAENRACGSS